MKKRTDILYLSNPDERVEHRKLSRLAHFIRFGIQILFILFPNSRKHTNDSGFYWRRVQDSNLWTAINRHGLASRCITTLPTLRVKQRQYADIIPAEILFKAFYLKQSILHLQPQHRIKPPKPLKMLLL